MLFLRDLITPSLPSYSSILREEKSSLFQRALCISAPFPDTERPAGAEKLNGDEKYRFRQGNYRILYTVEELIITVTIVKVGQRRDVYR
jgi:mRNA interferase RelE/StbE